MQLKRRPFRPPDTFHVHRSAPSLCQTNRPVPINLIGHRDCTETVSGGEETAGGENCSSEERGWSISVPRFTLFIVFFFSAFPFVLDQFFFSLIFIHSKIYFTLFSSFFRNFRIFNLSRYGSIVRRNIIFPSSFRSS